MRARRGSFSFPRRSGSWPRWRLAPWPVACTVGRGGRTRTRWRGGGGLAAAIEAAGAGAAVVLLEKDPALGGSTEEARTNADELFGSFAQRFTNVERDARFAAARLATVRHTVAVMSGKGGVGKSSVTVNLAAAIAAAPQAAAAFARLYDNAAPASLLADDPFAASRRPPFAAR